MNRLRKYFSIGVFLGLAFGIPGAVGRYVNDYIIGVPPNWYYIPSKFFNKIFFIKQLDVLNPIYKSVLEIFFVLVSFTIVRSAIIYFAKTKIDKKGIIFDFCIFCVLISTLCFVFYNANRYFIYSRYIFDINKLSVYIFSIIFTTCYFVVIILRNNKARFVPSALSAGMTFLFITEYIRLGVKETDLPVPAHLLFMFAGGLGVYTLIYSVVSFLISKFSVTVDKIFDGLENFLYMFSRVFSVFLIAISLIFLGFEVYAFSKHSDESTVGEKTGKNIVLITIETTRADHVGSYGYSKNTTPSLDKFFADKIIFTDSSSTWPATAPSMVSMLTSKYFYWHKTNKEKPTETNVTFLQEILKEEGFRTAAFVCNWVLEKKNRKIWRGFDIYDDEMPNWYILRTFMERSARQVNRKVFSWLKHNKDRNFFLWLHYNDPHGPYVPPRAFAEKFNVDEYGKEKNVEISEDFYIKKNEIPKIQQIKGIKDCRYYVSRYDAELNYTDREINNLLNFLGKLGLLENTIVIVTADHGEAMAGDYGYYFTHDEGLTKDQVDVPLFMHIPGYGARKIHRSVSLISVFPTILDLLNIKTGYKMEGPSLLKLIEKDEGTGNIDDHVFCEYKDGYSIKTERFRLIYNKDGKVLYDRKEDPEETTNVYDKYKTEDNVKKIETLLAAFREKAGKYKTIPERYETLSEDLKMKLKSLGYLN